MVCRSSFIFLFLFIGSACFSQFGATLRYQISDFEKWNRIVEQQNDRAIKLFNPSFEMAFDYWLRLPDKRIEFYPEINYSRSKTELIDRNGQMNQYRHQTFGFGLNANVYPFDFWGDCDCPTFSKQGDFFKKGFFLRFGVNIQAYVKEMETLVLVEPLRNTSLGASFSGGVGFDFGITDLLTVSPTITYRITPRVSWSGLSAVHELNPEEIDLDQTSARQLQFGIRLGFRPDFSGSQF